MRKKLIQECQGERTYALVFDKGDPIIEILIEFARQNDVGAAYFTGLGALRSVDLAYFDGRTMDYIEIPVHEQVEVVSFMGNIAKFQGDPKIHSHMVVARQDGSTTGGHLVEGAVWPTLELMVVATSEGLTRQQDEETGLALLDI